MKMCKTLVMSLVFILLFSGCISNDTNESIFQYEDSFVGDNSAVSNITNQLPGADQMNSFELHTDKNPYGITLNYDWKESEQAYKESVMYHGTFLFKLVQNVDWITFKADLGEYRLTKEMLEEWYDNKLEEVQQEEELRELIENYLEDDSKVSHL